jgi:poly(3-hydroxybutyrate) depolymerase
MLKSPVMMLALMLAVTATPVVAAPVPVAVVADPPADRAAPAHMIAFQLPSEGAMLNAVIYVAAGKGPHPTLLLLHGFPGNEQNLDLAQAARRAGWNVLTLHYRGSWGSPGPFPFTMPSRMRAMPRSTCMTRPLSQRRRSTRRIWPWRGTAWAA